MGNSLFQAVKLSVLPNETERNQWYAQSVNGKYLIMNKFLEEMSCHGDTYMHLFIKNIVP